MATKAICFNVDESARGMVFQDQYFIGENIALIWKTIEAGNSIKGSGNV
jgi:hypothetical protein